MNLAEAIAIRERQLQGQPVPQADLEEAMAVIARSGKQRRQRTYGITSHQRRAIDKAQIRMLKTELGETP